MAVGAAAVPVAIGASRPLWRDQSGAPDRPDDVARLTGRGGLVAAEDTDLDGRAMARSGSGRWSTGELDTETFRMVGVTWRGTDRPSVRVRTRTAGRWSGWQPLPLLDDGPDPGDGTDSAARRGTHPLWVGEADGVEVLLVGTRPAGLRLALIDPGRLEQDVRVTASQPAERPAARTAGRTAAKGQGTTSDDGDGGEDETAAASRGVPRPEIFTRGDWGADESLREKPASLCRTIHQMHVHHTASGNDYSRDDVPGLIRGFYRYHTQSLGWSDIGYNFLVDRFGRIWVGRAGGAGRPIKGAHTLGFNNTSFGVAVIGNLEGKEVWGRAVKALVHLGAWKLDMYDRSPRGSIRVWSTGSDKYPKGWHKLRVIDGHRDTNDTACPGQTLYDRIPDIRKRTKKRIKKLG